MCQEMFLGGLILFPILCTFLQALKHFLKSPNTDDNLAIEMAIETVRCVIWEGEDRCRTIQGLSSLDCMLCRTLLAFICSALD